MEKKMNGFWLHFGLMAAGAAISLAGAIIGRMVIGTILYGLGLAIAIAVAVWIFVKKDYFKEDRLKPLILGLVVGILLASSIVLLTGSGSSAAVMKPPMSTANATNQMGPGASTGNFARGGNFPGANGTTNSDTTRTAPTGMPTRGASAGSSVIVTVLGWVLLGLGLAVVIFFAIRVFTKKTSFAGPLWKVLVLGLVIGGLIACATLMMFVTNSRSTAANFPQLPEPSGQVQTGAQTGTDVAATEIVMVATETVTPEPTVTPTKTPKPTTVPTVETISRLALCMSADEYSALKIYTFPSEDTGKIIGHITRASCFMIDGKASDYPGWYHMSSGQSGISGVNYYTTDLTESGWVFITNSDASQENLNSLPDMTVAN